MKKLNRKLIKGTNWALAGLLGLLGIAGCEKEAPVEYGVPHASYEIFGTVKNGDGQPVEGINVGVHSGYGYYDSESNQTKTNSNGVYSKKIEANGIIGDLTLVVSDIDGEANGLYQNDIINVKIEECDYYEKRKGAWYMGAVRKRVDITLKKKGQ